MMIDRTIDLHGTHNRFLDALKGYAILFVLLNHSMPLFLKSLIAFDLWGGCGASLPSDTDVSLL